MKYLLIGLVILMNNVFAVSENEDSLKVYTLEDSIVVVADRYRINLKNQAYNYQLVSKENIAPLAVHSALETVDMYFPSAYIMEKKVVGYGVGTAGSGQVYLRGQGGHPNTGVLVLLNGHPDFMGVFGHPLPDVYGLDDVEQVEILAGPASTVFGSQAQGGVINIVTRPDYKNPLRFRVESGSYNTFNAALNLSHRIEQHGVYLSARRKITDGHIAQTGFESWHLQGGWEYQFSPQWELSVSGRYVPYSFDDPSRGENDAAALGTYGKIDRATGEIIVRNSSDRLQGSGQLYFNYGKHRFFDGYLSHDYTAGFSAYQYLKINGRFSVAAGTDLIQYGGKAKNDFARLPNGQPVVNPEQHEMFSAGLYTLAFYQPFSSLNLKAGLRYQHYSHPFQVVSPMAGLTWHISGQLSYFMSYQNGFRVPTLMELYLFPSANADLEKEQINSTETGLSYSYAGNNLVSLVLYRNTIQDKIQNLAFATPPPMTKFINSASENQWGIESRCKQWFSNNISGQFSYSYLDAGNLLAFNPEHQFKYMISARLKNYRFNLFGKYVESLYTENITRDNPDPQRIPDYHVLNLAVEANFGIVNAHLKLLNLLDREYLATVIPELGNFAYRAPGFHILAGIEVKI